VDSSSTAKSAVGEQFEDVAQDAPAVGVPDLDGGNCGGGPGQAAADRREAEGHEEVHAAFQPTFLYELIWDFALAGLLVWLGHHRRIRPPGLFALYVAGYSAFRIFEESLRVNSSQYFLGLRLNMYIAAALTLAGARWFLIIQRRGRSPAPGPGQDPESRAGGSARGSPAAAAPAGDPGQP
jgi:prolipoprotein diacylglyceryltransferase